MMVPSARLAIVSKLSDLYDRVYEVEALEKRSRNRESIWLSYQKKISKAYDKKVKPRSLSVRYLVLKIAGHIQKGLSASYFVSRWEGPYIIREA